MEDCQFNFKLGYPMMIFPCGKPKKFKSKENKTKTKQKKYLINAFVNFIVKIDQQILQVIYLIKLKLKKKKSCLFNKSALKIGAFVKLQI